MEQLTGGGAIAEGEWSSLSGTFTAEEAAFMAQLLNTTTTPDPFMAALHQESGEFSNNNGGSSFCSQLLFPTENNNYYPVSNYCLGELGNNNINGGFQIEDDQEDSMNNNIEMSESNYFLHPCSQAADKLTKLPEEEEGHHLLENCKKRSRRSEEVQKRMNERSKKTQKLSSTSNTEEDGNAGHSRQSTSTYCSEDESNASLEINGGTNNSGSSSKGPAKSRASRGSATDPQSLYARKRRERINERLRILQNLVPNGTKVDISTMLEEAVHYVKFLQLQIKLLSSDDLWMYAPIAYNGMDIGLNPTPNTPKES